MFNANLHVPSESFKLQFKFLQYNVDQATREEAFEETKWANRASRVKALIEQVDADIVCLQEFRRLPGYPSRPEEFLASFGKYRFAIHYRNSSPMAFGQAILYKPEKFFPVQSAVKWLSDTPDVPSDSWAVKQGGSTGFGYIVNGLRFVPVEKEKIVFGAKSFWVFNTHFGLEEDLKTKSCHKLLDIVKQVAGPDEYLVAGDFNLFPDRDGDKQKAILTAQWKDLCKGAVTLGGKQVEGTFVGYEHDDFKADLKNMNSRLDHVFSSQGLVAKNPVLYTRTMLEQEPQELTTRAYPSDHLPLVVDIEAQQ